MELIKLTSAWLLRLQRTSKNMNYEENDMHTVCNCHGDHRHVQLQLS